MFSVMSNSTPNQAPRSRRLPVGFTLPVIAGLVLAGTVVAFVPAVQAGGPVTQGSILTSKVGRNGAVIVEGTNVHGTPKVRVRRGSGKGRLAIRVIRWHGASGFQHSQSFFLIRPKRGNWPRGVLRVTALGNTRRVRVVAADRVKPLAPRFTSFRTSTVATGFPGRSKPRKVLLLTHTAPRDAAPVLRLIINFGRKGSRRTVSTTRIAVRTGRGGGVVISTATPRCVIGGFVVDPAGNRRPLPRYCP